MKKAIAIFAALLTLVMISTVAAAPKEKSQFESSVTFNAEYQFMQNGMMYVYGVEAIAINGDQGPLILGDLWAKLIWAVDLNTGQGSFRGDFEISSVIGSFEGKVNGIVNTDPQGTTAQVSGSFIGFGTGYYAFQKIKGSFDGSVVYETLQITLTVNGLLQSKDV